MCVSLVGQHHLQRRISQMRRVSEVHYHANLFLFRAVRQTENSVYTGDMSIKSRFPPPLVGKSVSATSSSCSACSPPRVVHQIYYKYSGQGFI